MLILVGSKGWGIVLNLLEDYLVDLMKDTERADSPDESFARVKYQRGFGQALSFLKRLSSQEEIEDGAMEQMEPEDDGEGLRRRVARERGRPTRRRSPAWIDEGEELRRFPYGF